MSYETVMGLEVHVELSTKTKIFCGCSTDFGGEPNSHTCPVCCGLPGALPVLNREVVQKALMAGLALNCEITEHNIFDRKNYFYPDSPKDYQISQLYAPICTNGWVDLDIDGVAKRVRIHEIHMEEDAGKLVHESGASLVDFNRCGVPLIEIVTEPDLRSAAEVTALLDKLREILVYLDVSDCRMEEGSMRADVNISVKPEDQDELGIRTETKNMNSIKAISRAIEFERARQEAVIASGGTIIQETRRWDDNVGETYSMRSKENAQDYRYFPDPDLVPVHIDKAWIADTKKAMPELASEKRERYINEQGIAPNVAAVLTADKDYADLFEAIASEGADAREAANMVAGDISYLLSNNASLGHSREGGNLRETPTSPTQINSESVAVLIKLITTGKINRPAAKQVLEQIVTNGVEPLTYVEENSLSQIDDEGVLESAVDAILSRETASVSDYNAGKTKALGFLVGQVMKELGGKGNPQKVNIVLKEKLVAGSKSETRSSLSSSEKKYIDSDLPEDAGGVVFEKDEEEEEEARGKAQYVSAWRKKQNSKDSQVTNTDANPVIASEARQSTDQGHSRDQCHSREGGNLCPPQTSNRYRTLNCGELRVGHVGTEQKLAGWVHRIRNHGGIIFVDLRDMYGMTQIVVNEAQVADLHKETSISVIGKVVLRDEETINPNIVTGDVELKADAIEILGPCEMSLPFEIDSSEDVREELRLKYRYLDLRNPKVVDRMLMRSEIIKHLRTSMEAIGFTEVQTPILANSSPEGARDYLIPSRKHKGKFYALPQAPQQFKQLLMVSGIDKYFQIAPCFRDEDARLDRSPGEFYQLDFEMAYATQEDVFAVAEHVLSDVFATFTDKQISKPPYVRIPYRESMLRYGSDKPDLRNPLFIFDLSEFFAKVDFAPFRGKIVRAIRVPDAAKQSKSWFKSMENFALSIGMKGLGYVTVQEDGSYKGPIDKFLTDEQKIELKDLSEIQSGDVLYFISDEASKVASYAGQIRTEVANRLDLIPNDRFEFCFITDYPMYELDEETGEIGFTHNPFSMPQGEMDALRSKDPLDILAWQYDIVVNGVELSSGAVRNHRPDIMKKAFEIAGYTEKDVEEKFGALYSAFSFGAPPHAGMAPGVDRIVMLLADVDNIKEIIAFPLNANAQNTMLGAPGDVTEQQLRDVHIKIR